MNMNFIRKLPIPQEVKRQYPITPALATLKAKRDEEIRAIFEGKDDRLLLVIGPCSADSEDSVLEYIGRLRLLEDRVKDRILIIPRIYTGKPRTTGMSITIIIAYMIKIVPVKKNSNTGQSGAGIIYHYFIPFYIYYFYS